jgi:hypothetical protein
MVGGDSTDHFDDEEGGKDVEFGRGGVDFMASSPGNGKLFGGAGDDSMAAGSGNDRLYGAPGEDTAYYDGPLAGFAIEQRGKGFAVTETATGDPD